MIEPLDPYSEVVDVNRRWTPDWYEWLRDLAVAVGTGGGGGPPLTDAPSDGKTYGRLNTTWTQVLPITGGTLTGNVTIKPASGATELILNKSASGVRSAIQGQNNGLARWVMAFGSGTAETGSNVGSDFNLQRYNDAGTIIDTIFQIKRDTGAFLQTVASGYDATYQLSKGGSGRVSSLIGANSGNARWAVNLGDTTTETGSNNVGSNFTIQRFTDAGALIDTPLTISRGNPSAAPNTPTLTFTGLGVFQGAYVMAQPPAGSDATFYLNKPTSGRYSLFYGTTNGSLRWAFVCGDNTPETGSNAGSNFACYPYSDASVQQAVPFAARRSDGVLTFGSRTNQQIDQSNYQVNMRIYPEGGFSIRTMTDGGVAAAFQNSVNTNVGYIQVNATNTVYATTSDRRLKSEISPFKRGRELLDKLQVHDFIWNTSKKPDIGLIAQEAENVHPHAVVRPNHMVRSWGIDYSKYVPLLIQALQDAHKRIDELEQRLT